MKDKIAELLLFYGDQSNELSEKVKELGLEKDTIIIGGLTIFNEEDDSVAHGSNFFVEGEEELDFAIAMLEHAYEKKDSGYKDFLDMINEEEKD